jgi:hypothetical protein
MQRTLGVGRPPVDHNPDLLNTFFTHVARVDRGRNKFFWLPCRLTGNVAGNRSKTHAETFLSN